MIDTEQAICKRCGRPIEIKEIGPHKREYCDDKGACRQAAYRQRKKAQATQHNVTMERIAELEQRNAELERELAEARKLQKMWEDKYYGEERYHTDTRVRHFKYWLRQHPKPNDTDFFKRFLADRRINESASRSMYEARLRLNGYSEEDMALFHVAWRDMLFFDRG